jgi:hypothetical protein
MDPVLATADTGRVLLCGKVAQGRGEEGVTLCVDDVPLILNLGELS